MKAVFCEKLGQPRDLVVREIEPPGAPAPGQLKVSLRAHGVSFADTLRVAGTYQDKSPLPFIPGNEAAGVVTEVGADVEGFRPGDRVIAPLGWVEEALIPAARATRIPEGVPFDQAAGFRGNYMTALYGLQRARLQPGEVLLIHGAAGGAGLAAVDVGKLMGATVIATASSEEKLALVKRTGADHTIDYRGGFREAVLKLTGDRGADVIYDPVGGAVFEESMRCIAPLGRLLVVGFAGGTPALAKTNHLLVKDAEVIGFTVGNFMRREPAAAERCFQVLLSWLAAGRIHPYVSHRLPLDQAAAALELIQSRKALGKIVLV